jgi:uncharacterized SAM-binding protein YcdF (DUF218 family)
MPSRARLTALTEGVVMFDTWWLLQPSSLLAFSVLLAAVTLAAGARRLAATACAFALLLVAVPLTFDVAGRLTWELERRVDSPNPLPERVDGVLVLGGAVDWRVSRERGQLNVNDAAERMMAAAALARRYPDARLVLTGLYREDVASDFGATPRDASLIFGEEFRGRPIEFIGESRSTYEDALLALERLSPSTGQSWLLVTSAMHMPRALAVFSTLDWRLTPYPVDYRTAGKPPVLNADPRLGETLAELDEAVREWGAILIYLRTGRIEWP